MSTKTPLTPGDSEFTWKPSVEEDDTIRLLAEYDAGHPQRYRLADMYYEGLRIANDRGHRDALAAAAHCFRELMEKFERTNSVRTSPDSLGDRCRTLRDSWAKCMCSPRYAKKTGEWRGQIDNRLRSYLAKTKKFFEDFENDFPTVQIQAERLPLIVDGTWGTIPRIQRERHAEQWRDIRENFEEVSHHRPDAEVLSFPQWVSGLNTLLWTMLRPLSSKDMDRLDGLITTAEADPSFESAKLLISGIKTVRQHRYVFRKLESGELIPYLKKAGAFERPERSVKIGGREEPPDWPPSRYLVKMCPKYSEWVRDIFLDLLPIENERVYEDMIDAAVKMHPKVAADLIRGTLK